MVVLILHDPHKISEPFLVLSGLAFSVPAYVAFVTKRDYDFVTCAFLIFTSSGFHATRNEYFFILDCLAILNFVLRYMYISFYLKRYLFCFVTLYNFTSYFGGQVFRVLSFDPIWESQMVYHSLLHFLSAYASYELLSTYL